MRVEWEEDALAQLADLHVAAPDQAAKAAVAATAERVTARLAEEGMFLGESRENPYRRVWFHYPMAVMYEVERGGGTVIYHVVGLRPRRDQE